MNIVPWRERNEVGSFRYDLDTLFHRFLGEEDSSWKLPAAFRRNLVPAVNVSETEKAWTCALELPGLEEKDIQVKVMGNKLVVSGERKWEAEKKGKEFHRVESQYGSFQRSILLPENVRTDPDAIMATYKRGMLEITLPKVEPTPAATIPVKAG